MHKLLLNEMVQLMMPYINLEKLVKGDDNINDSFKSAILWTVGAVLGCSPCSQALIPIFIDCLNMLALCGCSQTPLSHPTEHLKSI